MQREADALVKGLREFVAQPDYPTLVLNGDDASMVFPNRILSALDRQDEAAYYLLFPEPCTSAPAYMDAIATRLATQLDIFNTELGARQMPPLPPLPLEVQDARHPPARRLRAAIDYCAENLPPIGPIVWGLLPGELTDRAGYQALIAPLLCPTVVEPWMDPHRFVVRDQRTAPFLVEPLRAAKNDRVLVMDLDFSNERAFTGLIETASDRNELPDVRMNAFFQIATVDFAFKRYPEALEKFGVCFNFFQQQGNALMQSLCLAGAGDTLRQAGRPLDALKHYQQSLGVSGDDKNAATMRQGLYGAGCACLEADRNAEAEGYLTHANAMAGKANNPFAKCDTMEKLGVAKWRLGKVEEAADVWVKGKELAKQFSYTHRALSILDHLIAVSRISSLPHRVAAFEREKAELAAANPGAA